MSDWQGFKIFGKLQVKDSLGNLREIELSEEDAYRITQQEMDRIVERGVISTFYKGSPPSGWTDSDFTKDTNEHQWVFSHLLNLNFCSCCGIVKKRDGNNSQCKGIVRLALRDTQEGA